MRLLFQIPLAKGLRYNEGLKTQGIKASYQKLKAIEIPSFKEIAEVLEIEIGAKVIQIIAQLVLAAAILTDLMELFFKTMY